MCRSQLIECRPFVVPDTPHTISLSGEDATELFGMCIDDTLHVTHVTDGSVAKRENVNVGDRLIGVNGLPCWSREVTERIVRATTATCRLVFELPTSASKPLSARDRIRSLLRRIRVWRRIRM